VRRLREAFLTSRSAEVELWGRKSWRAAADFKSAWSQYSAPACK
jgi:hypothetical protein